MRTPHVNYDRIAGEYDRRFSLQGPTVRGGKLLELAARSHASRILEVGCGTGHWLGELHAPPRHLYGLDPSSGMLRQAQRRPIPIGLARGYARHLPFRDDAFDLVFCFNALHHFADPHAFVDEAWRVLCPGGSLAIFGSDPHDRRDDWYIYAYFEGTWETDLARFPAWAMVSAWMADAGFEDLELGEAERIEHPKRGRAVLADPFLRKHACSQLALLSDKAYEAGLRRIEAALSAAEARGVEIVFPSQVLISMLVGHKTPSASAHPPSATCQR